ncbi:MAG: EAL domain-containing protein [Clostridium sp.]|uniref:bifunctional diguanylate cyclase/phosphodiesterase n=1 Tax=Clostridium sp. TaxID=1506 RepID=UPI0025C57A41|nr:EAL domain-containing protein [Clostridium sp.]MBS4957106.1 EAL domain-containing protein [Clostridium sp.]
MIFTRKMNIKLVAMGTIFIFLLIVTNGILMKYGLQRGAEFTYQSYYKERKSELQEDIGLVKGIIQKLAQNRIIVQMLEEKRNFNDISQSEKNKIIFEGEKNRNDLKSLIFINTIDIINERGQYLFSKDEIKTNSDLMSMPWIKEEYFNMKDESIVTEVYKDPNTDKYKISIVRFIYSENNGELLGAAIFDIYIEDLIKFYNSDFYTGDLETYIKINDDEYFCSKGIVKKIESNNDNYVVSLNDVLDNGTEIILEFDKASIVYLREMKEVNVIRIIIFSVTGIIYVLLLNKLIKATFKPIMKSLDKLKVLLDNLEKNNFDFESNDEFKQLEFISDSLSKSFDKKIQSLIYYDELTKLPNRKMLVKVCNDFIDANIEFALIFIDLNKFKYINDVFGHSIGDKLLVNFSSRMEKCLGNKGIVTRYSGDEFIIVYNRYKGDEELKEFYKNVILKEFKEPIILNNDQKIKIKFSGGVAVYPRDGRSFNELIDKSDFTMYSSKKASEEDQLLFFNDDIYNKIIKIENIKNELKNAVHNNEFILYYQPIVDRRREIKKVEVLIRWNNDKLGFVSPDDFISYAEESGDIINIGYWVIEEVCKNFNEFFNNGKIIQVSINVSPIQLMEINFVEKVIEIAKKYNVDLCNLCFEITESVVLDENIIVYDNINLLYKAGAKIALDDFGTGYASFSYLKKFKLDILKIDKIFIDNCSDIDYKIVNNVKNIAHLLNMKTVVEGVETEKQFNILKELGCDYFQGYYFAKPMELDELVKCIRSE